MPLIQTSITSFICTFDVKPKKRTAAGAWRPPVELYINSESFPDGIPPQISYYGAIYNFSRVVVINEHDNTSMRTRKSFFESISNTNPGGGKRTSAPIITQRHEAAQQKGSILTYRLRSGSRQFNTLSNWL